MKQKLLLTLAVLAAAITASAENYILYTSTDEKIIDTYGYFGANIISNTYENGQGKIVCDGEIVCIHDAFNWKTNLKTIEIPNSVTEIGYRAFSLCSNLTSVKMSSSTQTIGESAFSNCTSLTEIEIPSTVTSIGKYAFNGCTSLSAVEIPNSVTDIYSPAFSGCTGLSSFSGKYASEDNRCLVKNDTLIAFAPSGLTAYTVPDNVKIIGTWAFNGCSQLKEIDFPYTLTEIQDYAFYNCGNLSSIEIPASVTEIGVSAFSGCYSLPVENNIRYAGPYLASVVDRNQSSYTIREGTKWIGGNAFSNCKNMTTIELPNSIVSIERSAFSDCTSLQSINLPSSLTSIPDRAFYNCYSLNSLEIPTTVTDIGSSAFYCCTKLTSVNIPNGITEIKNDVFSNCWSLESVEIPNTVTKIGANGFAASGLKSVVIPNSVTEIGRAAFCECQNLSSVVIPESVEAIGNFAFYKDYSLPVVDGLRYADTYLVEMADETQSHFQVKEGTKWIGVEAFMNKENVTSIELPNTVTTFCHKSLMGCKNLRELIIPSSVTSIESYSLCGCESLTSLEIPNSVTFLGPNSIEGCHNLKTSVIGKSIDALYLSTFLNCPNLESIVIGKSVSKIEDYVLYGCEKLTEIVSLNTQPPHIEEWSTTVNIIANMNFDLNQVTVKVPAPALDDYKAAFGWRKFFNIVPLSDEEYKALGVEEVSIQSPAIYRGTYNLQGQPVCDGYKGIVVKDGKKYLRK